MDPSPLLAFDPRLASGVKKATKGDDIIFAETLNDDYYFAATLNDDYYLC
jgi:hypothetical protein